MHTMLEQNQLLIEITKGWGSVVATPLHSTKVMYTENVSKFRTPKKSGY